MSGHGHDGPKPVAHHYVVGNPDRYPGAINRIDRKPPGEHAGLFFVYRCSLNFGLLICFKLVGFHRFFLIRAGDFFYQRVFRRQDHKGGTPERIRPGGEHSQVIPGFCLKGNVSAF